MSDSADSIDIFSDCSSSELSDEAPQIGKDSAKVLEELKREVEVYKPEVKTKVLPVKRTIADVEAEVKQAREEGELIKNLRKRQHYANLRRPERREA